MKHDAYTINERNQLDILLNKLGSLRRSLEQPFPEVGTEPAYWYKYLDNVKESQGNLHIWISFIACLMAKDYITHKYNVTGWDVAEKAQGAPGLDIDIKTGNGKNIIGEIKTTTPYEKDDFGAAQWTSLERDFEKLRQHNAGIKYLFVTNEVAYKYLERDRDYIRVIGLKVVLLPSGKTFTV